MKGNTSVTVTIDNADELADLAATLRVLGERAHVLAGQVGGFVDAFERVVEAVKAVNGGEFPCMDDE